MKANWNEELKNKLERYEVSGREEAETLAGMPALFHFNQPCTMEWLLM